MSGAALSARGLRFLAPDGRALVDGVSLAVPQGERFAIVGPNGAGKTTLLRMLASDLAARTILPSQELPVGIVTNSLGAVFVVAMLLRR